MPRPKPSPRIPLCPCGAPLELWQRNIAGYTRTSTVCSGCKLSQEQCFCIPKGESETESTPEEDDL